MQSGSLERYRFMSSISVGELKQRLEDIPDDYEVTMELSMFNVRESRTMVADINGIKVEEEYREVHLMN